MELQELTTIEDFQGLIAEDFYMSGKDNFPEHSESIEHRMFDELGRGLYRLARKHPLLIGGVAEFYVDVSQDDISIRCELIVGKFAPPNGRALAYVPDLDFDFIKAEFGRGGSISFLYEGYKYQIYLTKDFIKIDAVAWVLGGQLKLNQTTDKS